MKQAAVCIEVKKEKRTRRRLRLSCVECTKRRQKCDRNYPCSLCISRGVSHLCRWETVPVARPLPARPPADAPRISGSTEQDELVKQLTARVSMLEQALANQRGYQSIDNISTGSPRFSTSPSTFSFSDDAASNRTSPDISPSPAYELSRTDELKYIQEMPLLENGVYETTSTLAQLSLAHHGEFIGRGSSICALHAITSKHVPRFLYAKSTDPIAEQGGGSYRSPMPFTKSTGQELIRNIPPASIATSLIEAFIAEVNWRFGIPEDWFHLACAQMWLTLQYPQGRDPDINANWLVLFFAVLACVPTAAHKAVAIHPSVKGKEDYFIYAMLSKRVTEDVYLSKPSNSIMSLAADGTVMGCLAVPLLCSYLAERSRVSEAWKLVGNTIRTAQAIGLHRDPGWAIWQLMSEEEKLLRRRAWWGLIVWDTLLSHTLGRPPMVKREFYDVEVPSPLNADGTHNFFGMGQNALISLAKLVEKAIERCFNVDYPPCRTFLEMDEAFQMWVDKLPPYHRQHPNPKDIAAFTDSERLILSRQRYVLHAWYYISRIKLHIAAATGQTRPAQILSHVQQSQLICISLSMECIRFQCEAFDAASRQQQSGSIADTLVYPDSSWFFVGSFSLFEAVVAMVTTIARNSMYQSHAADAEELMNRALEVFTRVSHLEGDEVADSALKAIEVLIVLREEHWWKWPSSNGVNKLSHTPPFPSRMLDCSSIPSSISSLTRYAVSAEREHDVLQDHVPKFGLLATR